MNHIHKLENKKEQLKSEITLKEKKFSEQLNNIFNTNGEDTISRITKKLTLITTLYEGARMGVAILKHFKQ